MYKKENVLNAVQQFRTTAGYKTTATSHEVCPQVNGLSSLSLAQLGYVAQARQVLEDLKKSQVYDASRKLYLKKRDDEASGVLTQVNSCKNATVALAHAYIGLTSEAKEILANLTKSPLYDSNTGLFSREYNVITSEVNRSIYAQSNLWVALAYANVNMPNEAQKIVRALEKTKLNLQTGFFVSSDCKNADAPNKFFSDDQALAGITYAAIGEKQKSYDITSRLISSPLYDAQSGLFRRSMGCTDTENVFSTYKNSIIAHALKLNGFNQELAKLKVGLMKKLFDAETSLFDQTTADTTKVPDNSLMALVALNF